MWSKIAVHPGPVGDCARKPTAACPRGGPPPKEKYRSSRHHFPSDEAWKAQAGPVRVTRSHSARPLTSKQLQSSEAYLVTTVTAVGRSGGESSKHSLAQCCAPA